jgi:hypothetical protein
MTISKEPKKEEVDSKVSISAAPKLVSELIYPVKVKNIHSQGFWIGQVFINPGETALASREEVGYLLGHYVELV